MAITVYNDVKKIKIGNDVFNLYDSGGTVTSIGITDGEGLTSSGGPITSSGNITLSLDAATSSTLGGIKVGYGASGKNYAIALDSSNNAYVNVPWTDTNTKVTQTNTTTNSEYRVLFSANANDTTETTTARKNTNLRYNPNTSTFTTSNVKASKVTADQGVFDQLIAQDVTATNMTVVGLLDVKGELHTNQWTNANISNVGGSFYISPTVTTDYTENSTSVMTVTISGSENARTMRVEGGNFATDAVKIYNNGSETTASWAVGSRVMITGNIRATVNGVVTDYPLGTCVGNIITNGVLATGGFIVGSIESVALENILSAAGTTSFTSKKIQISMFEIGPNTALKPVGIMMQSYGTDKSTYIDIYGGVNVKTDTTRNLPNVRIGYLGGLKPFGVSEGHTYSPKGWGIFTDNGYFQGTIVATSGDIGGWVISSTALSKGDFASSGAVWLVPGGKSSTSNIGGSGTSSHTWAVTASNKFGITTGGDLFASSATISGNITATSGTIGDCQIENGVLKVNTITGGTAGTSNYIYVSTVDSSRTINEVTKSDWRLILGNTFAVNKEGYITASTGKIGGWKTNTTSFSVDKTFIDATTQETRTISDYIILSNNELNTSKTVLDRDSIDWSMVISNTFGITSGGSLYSASATIAEGVLGPFNFDQTNLGYKKDQIYQMENNHPSGTVNGITFRRAGRQVVLYGTATANTSLYCLGQTTGAAVPVADFGANTTWTFGGSPEGGATTTYRTVGCFTANGTTPSGDGTTVYEYGTGGSATGYRYATLKIYLRSGKTYGTEEAPLVFTPYLKDETGKDHLERFSIVTNIDGFSFGEIGFISFSANGEGSIGKENFGDYLNYSLTGYTGTINLKASEINASSGVFTNLVTNSFIAESIGLNGEDLSARLTNLGTGITAVQASVNSLSANLVTNYYTKAEIDTKQADINNTITQNIGTINQSINQINNIISTMNDTFGVNTEFYFAKSSVKKWALRLGREVTTGKPNLNDIWIG